MVDLLVSPVSITARPVTSAAADVAAAAYVSAHLVGYKPYQMSRRAISAALEIARAAEMEFAKIYCLA